MPRTPRDRSRKIHVDLPEALHLKLRLKAAMKDVSMQALVTEILNKALVNVQVPHDRKPLHDSD